MSWTFDAPSNTYRNFALSTQIRREAIADAMFMKFLKPEPGYGKHSGESVTITRVMKLPLATRIGETDTIPSGRPAIQTKQVAVSQWGFKIPMTEFEKHLSHFDIMDPFQASLRDQMSLTMDQMAAQAFKKTPSRYTPQATGFTLTTSGAFGALSDRNLEVADLRRISDELAGNLKCPRYRNGKYVGILSTKAARGVKNDPEYKDWIAPSSMEPLENGRLKDIEGFALFETNNFDALLNTAGTSTVLGEAVFFGADAAGLVKVMDPEIRAGQPEELGTLQEVGWVGTLEAFLTWEQAANSRVIYVGST